MAIRPEIFREHILELEGVFDPKGKHHEYVSTLHGRKLDLGAIKYGTPVFNEWVVITAETTHRLYAKENLGKIAFLSIDEGTNELAPAVAEEYANGSMALRTTKTSPRSVELDANSKSRLVTEQPDLVLALEDVSVTGSVVATAYLDALDAGASRVEVLSGWLRSMRLSVLDTLSVRYNSVIHDTLPDAPNFSPSECAQLGYCADNWELVRHD